MREENFLDLFFLAIQGREESEFLEGRLDSHLKNVQPSSVDRRVNAVFHDRIEVSHLSFCLDLSFCTSKVSHDPFSIPLNISKTT
jgi:hypothetical protein